MTINELMAWYPTHGNHVFEVSDTKGILSLPATAGMYAFKKWFNSYHSKNFTRETNASSPFPKYII